VAGVRCLSSSRQWPRVHSGIAALAAFGSPRGAKPRLPPMQMDASLVLTTLAAAGAAGAAGPTALRRWQLSRAKHRSLSGHARIARAIARLVPGYAYDEAAFFAVDGAPAEVRAARRLGLLRLAAEARERHPRSLAATEAARPLISDLQFTGRYRVPFPFGPVLRRHLGVGAFAQATEGFEIEDLDGRRFIDLTGSYGVNVFGHAFYKRCIEEGHAKAAALGAVLGPYHPVVLANVRRIAELAGMDEVSLHMSGTEAVMQAVRLARYHTGRSHVVRFCGAYHGWWDDVQPGPGNPGPPTRTYTLEEMSERTLAVLATRRDIACVLVNPIQALHPNRPAPTDSALIEGRRDMHFDRAAYTAWLARLREVCTRRGIALVMDEVFMGFRLAPGGAQQHFGVRADLVTYGKTLGGGLPVGVLAGRAAWMRRFRDDRPADICFARGTFNAHPHVMGAMDAFLTRLATPEVQALYEGADERFDAYVARLNARLEAEALPLRIANLQSVWTVLCTAPSRYHWMLQFYLRAHGLWLSWVGSGRIVWPLNLDEATFETFCDRFVAAATAMRADGWWWQAPQASGRAMRRGVLFEMLGHRFGLRG
jgi:glutamate-1-semialdehyde 2,1-aminomutase